MASLGRVLVVDDDLDVASMLNEVLGELGYTVKVTHRGAEALSVMSIFQPDVVLLDLNMPTIRGEVVLEHLHRRYPRMAVIIVSANEDEDLARATLNAGAFDYIKKPFDFERLERVLGVAIAQGREQP